MEISSSLFSGSSLDKACGFRIKDI